jgi:hypothetical protein
MGDSVMESAKGRARGFTLIATLMLLLLMSGIAIGILMMVNTEGKVGTQDVQSNMTFHAAEGAIEKMTSDLATVFSNIESPTVSDITSLSALAPTNTLAMSYPVYTLTPATGANGNLLTNYAQIISGPYQGLSGQILPVTLQATAQGPLGDEVNMTRTVEVALIPAFQFGVFSDSDLGFYSSPNLNFAGRVHTNGDLYLGVANGYTLTFHDKITAWGNVIRANLPNGLSSTNASYNDNGNVLIPSASSGCDGAQPACVTMSDGANRWGSVTGAGGNPPQSGYNNVSPDTWQYVSLTKYNGWIIDGDYGNTQYGTGATDLTLPFVNGTSGNYSGPQPFEIIRRPPPGESSTSPLGASRLYNEASIRILLSDSPAELPGGASDPENVRLANFKDPTTGVDASHGWPASVPSSMPHLASGHSYTTYFATASTSVPDQSAWSATSNTLVTQWPYAPVAPPTGDVTLYDTNAPIMQVSSNGSGTTTAPAALNLSVCTAGTPPTCPGTAAYPYYTTLAYGTPPATAETWNLLDGYLRVEYQNSAGNYVPVTQEWLNLGFARGLQPPTSPGTNPVNPNAILLVQQPADRNGNGAVDTVGAVPYYTSSTHHGVTTYTLYPGKPPEATVDAATNSAYYGDSAAPLGQVSSTAYNWYPINFYDAREGEPRDATLANNSCTPAGIMNAVELDVGNLKQWLAGNIGVSGSLVSYTGQNGYVVYFSDRRGMLPNPNGTQTDAANTKTGDSGFEDAVNSSSASGLPDGLLEPDPAGKNFSPEDDNLNGKLDNFGSGNLGLGLGYVGAAYNGADQVNSLVNASGTPNPYLTTGRIANCSIAQNNWVSGARHVLKLVDGALGSVPVRPDNGLGGFTVGSENPVYITGNYNTNSSDTIWTTGTDEAHSAASVIADAVTVLSNNWSDWNSILTEATDPNPNRTATTTYYRVAIAGGKNINFPFPNWESATDYGFGTDGGVHNFVRFLENWSGQTLNYEGSLVSLYYSTYNTGTFKCCAYSVYEPPTRNYVFDPDFTQPQNLPPGTPLFRDIDNLSYRQSFTACTVNSSGVCTN